VPGLGPPNPTKLVNPVATHVPRATIVPVGWVWVKEPLAAMALVLESKVPEPVTRMLSPAKGPNGAIAVFGGLRVKLFGVAAAEAAGARATIDASVNRIPTTVNFLFMTIPSSFTGVRRL
jgi:hypothetical protein